MTTEPFYQRVAETYRKSKKSWSEYSEEQNCIHIHDTIEYAFSPKNWNTKFRKLAKYTIPISLPLYVITVSLLYCMFGLYMFLMEFLKIFTFFNEEK